ncbi:LCP family protein [Kouleothrix sp.]|uniref:LCP family protein n=1 Tax=Kouleothrix sp. TaxID=2779161 RepID=UPI00391C22DF
MATTGQSPSAEPRGPARPRRRWLPFAIGMLIGLALGGAALLYMQARTTLQSIQQPDARRAPTPTPRSIIQRIIGGGELYPTQPPLPDALREPFTTLLIGVDTRPDPGEGVRSDTLILVRVDPVAKWAAMLSIPRDSVTSIPHLGRAKINAAYSHGYANAAALYGPGTTPEAGGAALAAEAIENFLGVKVDYTAQVDFHGFAALVDSIGGVLVDVPKPLLDAEYPTDDYGVERIYIPAGLQVLDGRHALIYARSRHASTDFDRSQRQQRVLRAVLDQVRARGLLDNIATLPQWADVLAQNVRTTLPIGQLGMINGLAGLARELHGDRVLQFSINPLDVAIDYEDGSDIYWNAADVATVVSRWRAGPQAASQRGRIQVLNGAAVAGIAGKVSSYLRGQGFVLADPGQAPQVYEHSQIIDYTGQPETRQRLASLLGIDARYIQSSPAADAPARLDRADIVLIVGQDYQPRWAGE